MSDNYEVGYGKPPKHGQFKKGQSGNPKGRPKGSKNFKADLEAELKEQIPLKESGTSQKVTKQRALIKMIIASAINGDVRAQGLLFNMFQKLMLPEVAEGSDVELTPTDIAILEDFKKEVLKSANAPKPEKDYE
jgi:hypothetical protein